MLSPCYVSLDDALSQVGLVVRAWAIGEPSDVEVLTVHEEEPFAFALVRYKAPRRPAARIDDWFAGLSLKRERCGWIWVGGLTSCGDELLNQRTPEMSYHLSRDLDWRFWIAVGKSDPEVVEVRCSFVSGDICTVRPASDGWFVIGGRLRGPRELSLVFRDGRPTTTVALPRSFRYVVEPQENSNHLFEVETSNEIDVEGL